MIGNEARDVLGLDTPDEPGSGLAEVPPPSADLLARAQAGWQRFVLTAREMSDE
ncbi:hypothetical protein ACQKM2_13245 [Streptomyces sp. NPDC004126]|uniref:hypothetical protein n=1 Tax=Streptomyces sp. NPDC004126 TaxID=3390695 RepID=UPI003D06403C